MFDTAARGHGGEEQLLKVEPGARNVIGEAAGGELRLLPLTVAQYERMIDDGILSEDTGMELLDGVIVRKDRGDPGGDPMTVGEAHAYVVNQLAHLSLRLDASRLHLQTQQPVVIPEDGEPEPDAAIVLRPLAAVGKPRAKDVSCVVEVVGTSLERDRATKLRLYARGNIPQYIILDLAAGKAEEHLQPDPATGTYSSTILHGSGETLRLRLSGAETLDVPLADLFPPR